MDAPPTVPPATRTLPSGSVDTVALSLANRRLEAALQAPRPVTVMSICACAAPPLLPALTVTLDCRFSAVGVPAMAPVLLSRLSPAGKAGVTENATGSPPTTCALLGVMVSPTVYKGLSVS